MLSSGNPQRLHMVGKSCLLHSCKIIAAADYRGVKKFIGENTVHKGWLSRDSVFLWFSYLF